MGKRVVWHAPLSPAQIKEALVTLVDTEAGIPMFAPRFARFERGYLPLMGVFSAYGFNVQLQPSMADPFATFCTAAVKAEGTGSRVTAKFHFHGLASFLYFVAFGWATVLEAWLIAPAETSLPRRLMSVAVILGIAAAVALFARWRMNRDRPVLAEFLERKLQLAPVLPAPLRALEQAA